MAKKAKKAGAPRRRRAAPQSRRAAVGPDVRTLLHELQVHAEEITVQNEQLLKTQGELEEARDRFGALYDFAPIGYISIDRHGVIREINLTGASMFGRPRANLIKLPLAALIAREDRETWLRFLARAHQDSSGQPPSVEVRARTDGQHVYRLIARPGVETASGELFTAMMDVTEERRLEAERQARTVELEREVSERLAAESRVKLLLERLVTAQEEERRRLARNLHDHLGQQLTALGLTIDTISEDPRLPESLRQCVANAQGFVARLDKDVDLLAWDLRPAVLDLGLSAALADLVRQWASATEIVAEFHQTAPSEIRLPERAEANVYRIVQEALNNIAKHAGATHVSVLFEQSPDAVAVIVEDDGRGFDPDLAAASQARHAGMGLLSMRERAAQFDGSVQVESAPGQGTTVFVRIPCVGVTQGPTKNP